MVTISGNNGGQNKPATAANPETKRAARKKPAKKAEEK